MGHAVALAALSILAVLVTPAVDAQVVINEVHYNPSGDDATVQLEFIELYNAGGSSVDLSAWQLVFGPDPLVFPVGTSIGPGSYLVAAEKISALAAATGYTAAFEWQGLNAGLGNGGDDITLLDGLSVVKDVVVYDDDPPWPIAADGDGPSLELINPVLDNGLASAWRASTGTNGTPGAQNSVFSVAPLIQSETPRRLSAVETMPSVSVTFTTPVTGVVASDMTVNGSPATGVTGSGAGPYVFSGFTAPAPGSASMVLSSGAIQSSPGGVPFPGDAWTVSVGLVVVFNEIHYHPGDPNNDAEFFELYNAGTATADLSGWRTSDGPDITFAPGTLLPSGNYLVVALNPTILEAVTGYSGALQWGSGRLANEGERLALSDAAGNEIDVVSYSDEGEWPSSADGDGPSLELVHPRLPNELGAAWKASLAANGTPGATNSVFDPQPAPIIAGTLNTPVIPAPNQSVVITATIVDESAVPTATLYFRRDQVPTINYQQTPMFDDGLHGDGAAGDHVYGATATGFANGQRLDFTIRASDGIKVSAGPPGHDTLVAGENPKQTYLAEFVLTPPGTDLPAYHLITTQHTRDLQQAHTEDEYDATFLQCGVTGCKIFFNVTERYRGEGSLNLHPHSFRIDFSNDHPLNSEMGFEITKLNLMAQSVDKQHLGYLFFREAFGGVLPTSSTQFARLHTSPLSHGGTQDFAYINVEAVDEDFLSSQNGEVTPARFPDRCSGSGATCDVDADCPSGQTCVATSTGDLYRGRDTGDLQYLGTDPNSYRASYDKDSNVEEDDWTKLIDQCFVLDSDTTPDSSFESSVNAGGDEQEWARWFAIHMLLGNEEGGIYLDAGDDYFIYFEPDGSPNGRNAKFLTWDMDSVYGGFRDAFNQDTIWSTTVPTTLRFVRNNAYAGRFVGAICSLLDTDFTPAVQNARIDAIPSAVASGVRKQLLKNWVTDRIAFVNAEIVRTLTLTGVPASPYTNPDPVIAVSGQLSQCGAYQILLNGQPSTFSVFDATWSGSVTLEPGPNSIVVQDLDVNGVEIARQEATVVYAPPGPASGLRLTMPRRMLNDHTQTIEAEIVDSLGRIQTQGCPQWGTVSVKRAVDGTDVPITVTVFDPHLEVPDNGIRFYSGVGSVSFTLDDGASVLPGELDVTVTLGTSTVSKRVTVLAAPTFRSLSGTLSGTDLVWGPDETIRVTGNINIPSGKTLTIHEGTLVMVDTTGTLNNGTLITVDGGVTAVGTAEKPIHFFSERGPLAMVLTQSGPKSNANCYQGFAFNGARTSTFDYVFMTGGGNGQVLVHPRPPVLRFNDTAGADIDHCVFVDNNGMMISTPSRGTFTIRNSVFSRDGIGGEFAGNGMTLVLEDSYFTSIGHGPEPLELDGDLIHVDGVLSSHTISRCVFADGGDDGIDHSDASFTLSDSILYDMVDKSVSLSAGFLDVHNVLVYGAAARGGFRGDASCTNCTIAVASPLTIPHTVQESIIWDRSIPTCNGDIDYTIVGDPLDLGCGTGNASTDPLYRDTLNCDYRPAVGSPALHASPTGRRIGWLGFPAGQTCQSALECDDANPCTIDSCGDAGVCENAAIFGCTPCAAATDCDDSNPCTVDTCGALGTCRRVAGNDGATCDDGIACTEDVCSGGVCIGTEACPDPYFCDTSGVCVQPPVTATFQNDGVYAGTQDTWLGFDAPDDLNGIRDHFRWDTFSPAGPEYGLVRFDSIFGAAPGQIPVSSTILSATLGLEVINPSVNPPGEVHEVATDWSEATATYNNFGGEAGVQPDEIGALVADAPIVNGPATIDVTSSLDVWTHDPASNLGWIVVPTNTDGVRVRSSEWSVVAERPSLTVSYLAPIPCLVEADCSDGIFCNGAEVCTNGFCEPAVAAPCDDAIGCTHDSCDEAFDTCVHATDDALCDDGNACNGAETCSATQGCTEGTPPVGVVVLSEPDLISAGQGATLMIPALAVPAGGSQLNVRINFDSSVLQPLSVSGTTISQGFSVNSDLTVPGEATVSMSGPAPMTGAGAIFNIQFFVAGAAGLSTSLTLSQASIDGGTIPTCLESGRFVVCDEPLVEVTGLELQGASPTTLTWTDQGGGVRYDVASGLLSVMRADRSAVQAGCIGDDAATATFVDTQPDPAPGSGYYYMVRAQSDCGNGTYGFASSGEERIPTSACP